MEFLKNALDEQLYNQVAEKLQGNNKVKLANLEEGQYVVKYKFDKLERKFREMAAELCDLKKADMTALKAENENLKHQIAAIGKGAPASKADKYVKLAETYVTEKIGFAAALDLMLKDFPALAGYVPGIKSSLPDIDMQQKKERMLKKTAEIYLKAEIKQPDSEPGIVIRVVMDPAH